MTDDRPVIIIAATPTPNGDLHVGHLAGPYLAGDVYARFLRASGRAVSYTTCTDDSQSYVVTTAARRSTTPQQLCAVSTVQIGNSLDEMGISIEPLPPIDDNYRRCVLDFLTRLHTTGRLRERTVRLPYATRAGRYLYDGLVTGRCPICSATSCGGVCEDCGHPNNFDELLEARYTLDPTDEVVYRQERVLVLPMEEYRQQLTDYFHARTGLWRAHPMQLIRELLARPLPDIPITIPGDWGLAAPFAPTAGQIVYPWAEAMPASMYSTWHANGGGRGPIGELDGYWRADRGAEVVYFHGFDNTYHWGLMDLTLLMAHGDRYALPAANVCNEFYELEGSKFSTSRNHLMRGGELLAELPRDLIRFYLAMTAPEQRRTNFTMAGLHELTRRRLVEPWNALADRVDRLLESAGSASLPTTATGRGRAKEMLQRLAQCYQLPTFSMTRAAQTIAGELIRLGCSDTTSMPGDQLLAARALLAGAAPILVDLAEQAEDGTGLSFTGQPPDAMPARPLPRLFVRAGDQASPLAEPALARRG
ncbi:MAG TPA: class I tRNA ligase family protein [Jatrophihabitans sp.]|nr:class I tRNA ligase family protein [Jatrophihabitans sp.]